MYMPRKKKENLVHLDLETLAEEVNDKPAKSAAEQADKTLGDLLRETREKRRYHVATVSKKLKIKPVYIEALEKGHYYVFPGLVYGIGFLRSYAQFLGLDVKEVMERFHNETNGIKSQPMDMPIPENRNLLPSGKTVLKSTLLLIVVYLLWYIVHSFMTPTLPGAPVVTPTQPENASVETPIAGEENVMAPVEEVKPAEPVQEEPAPRTPKTYGAKERGQLSLAANAEVWIEITDADDVVVLSQTLYPGDVYNVPENGSDLRLKTGNAGGLDVLLWGDKWKVLGKSGEVLSDIKLTKRVLKKL